MSQANHHAALFETIKLISRTTTLLDEAILRKRFEKFNAINVAFEKHHEQLVKQAAETLGAAKTVHEMDGVPDPLAWKRYSNFINQALSMYLTDNVSVDSIDLDGFVMALSAINAPLEFQYAGNGLLVTPYGLPTLEAIAQGARPNYGSGDHALTLTRAIIGAGRRICDEQQMMQGALELGFFGQPPSQIFDSRNLYSAAPFGADPHGHSVYRPNDSRSY